LKFRSEFMTEPSGTARKYDKGERRHKHVGKGSAPTIEFEGGSPKKGVGMCPSTLTETDRVRLLNEAIPALNGDRELDLPKKLYVVHEGAIYEAQTSDGGTSYHGYPYRGKLPRAILTRLERMAEQKLCVPTFKIWVKSHITRHGERK
jgi:hypothetical protein